MKTSVQVLRERIVFKKEGGGVCLVVRAGDGPSNFTYVKALTFSCLARLG